MYINKVKDSINSNNIIRWDRFNMHNYVLKKLVTPHNTEILVSKKTLKRMCAIFFYKKNRYT